MPTTRAYDDAVQRPAAAVLRAVGDELTATADDVHDAGRTALDGAGQFAGELSEGAAVLSLSWAAAMEQAALSADTVAAVAVQALVTAQGLDAHAAAALSRTGPR